ncbi:MAG: TatD family hydrolase [Treponema sp.]|nr:TatD family hydrolase [Treponema sp.]
MYADSFLNFYLTVQEFGLEEGANILSRFGSHECLAIDTGLFADDIWKRAELVSKCLDFFDPEKESNLIRKIKQSIYFCAGVMQNSENIEKGEQTIALLEKNITEFRNSENEFSSHLVAIGPCGIDHDWESSENGGRTHDFFDRSSIIEERNFFEQELLLAKKLDLPVIVHSRKSFQHTMDILRVVKWNKGVIHGFSYSLSELEFFLNMGWYISFDGSITFSGKNKNEIAEMVSYVPLNRLLIESDSPFYAPIPVKGTVNSPENLKYIYEYIASKRKMQSLKLNEKIQNNMKKLFGIEQ